MRIVFMGTPEFAQASLQKLIETGHNIVGVFTQPDKPKGRGYKLVAPPVKELALEHKYSSLSAGKDEGWNCSVHLKGIKS